MARIAAACRGVSFACIPMEVFIVGSTRTDSIPIQLKNMNSLIDELEQRGLIQQVSDREALEEALNQGCCTIYCGFDPTADSLHVGHLLPILVLRRFQLAGHRPIALVGGATGLIGDPSFKVAERSLNALGLVADWAKKIRKQLEPFLNFSGETAAVLANNADWTASLDVLTFLREVGKHFSVNAMINKESVRQRLSREGIGISFTEFSYSLLQSYDFAQLNQRYNCILQIGGSDQWGNITSGIELTRRVNQRKVYGLTLPLITKADGTKFGKTEGEAVWLTARKTSPYQFYQFWLKVADADVYTFLKFFTFLSLEQIDAIREQDQTSAKKPEAQRILAEELTLLVHGQEALRAAQRISANLFGVSQAELLESDFEQLALDGLPTCLIAAQISIIDALKNSQLAKSNNEARAFIKNKAVYLNGRQIIDPEYILTERDIRFQRYTILQRGKRQHVLLVWD